MRMFHCCQTTINRAVRNHMHDEVDEDDALILDTDLPADVTAMLGLAESDDDKNQWQPWGTQTKAVVPRMPVSQSAPGSRTIDRRSPRVYVGYILSTTFTEFHSLLSEIFEKGRIHRER